jgi:hypothetical protein
VKESASSFEKPEKLAKRSHAVQRNFQNSTVFAAGLFSRSHVVHMHQVEVEREPGHVAYKLIDGRATFEREEFSIKNIRHHAQQESSARMTQTSSTEGASRQDLQNERRKSPSKKERQNLVEAKEKRS